MQAHILSIHTLLAPRWGQKVKYVFPYVKIKGNGAQSTMQAHIMSLHTASIPGCWVKVQTFFSVRSHVAYQINGNGAQSTVLVDFELKKVLLPPP